MEERVRIFTWMRGAKEFKVPVCRCLDNKGTEWIYSSASTFLQEWNSDSANYGVDAKEADHHMLEQETLDQMYKQIKESFEDPEGLLPMMVSTHDEQFFGLGIGTNKKVRQRASRLALAAAIAAARRGHIQDFDFHKLVEYVRKGMWTGGQPSQATAATLRPSAGWMKSSSSSSSGMAAWSSGAASSASPKAQARAKATNWSSWAPSPRPTPRRVRPRLVTHLKPPPGPQPGDRRKPPPPPLHPDKEPGEMQLEEAAEETQSPASSEISERPANEAASESESESRDQSRSREASKSPMAPSTPPPAKSAPPPPPLPLPVPLQGPPPAHTRSGGGATSSAPAPAIKASAPIPVKEEVNAPQAVQAPTFGIVRVSSPACLAYRRRAAAAQREERRVRQRLHTEGGASDNQSTQQASEPAESLAADVLKEEDVVKSERADPDGDWQVMDAEPEEGAAQGLARPVGEAVTLLRPVPKRRS